jgi:hypothetical protein
MENKSTLENQTPAAQAIYKDKAVWVGTFLGGPLVTGYLVAKNYKVFGEKDKIWKTWVVAIAALFLIFAIAFYAPYVDRMPNTFFVLLYTGIAYLVVRIWQGAKIDAHIRAGGKIHSWYRVIAVSIIGALLSVIPLVAFTYFSDTTTIKPFGNLKHEILFDKSNITENEVDKIGEAFVRTNFFDNEQQKFVDAKKVGNDYEIAIYCSSLIKNDAEAVRYFADLREEMQKMFPDRKIIFNLVINTPDNIFKRLE